jgi:hypothetical protein
MEVTRKEVMATSEDSLRTFRPTAPILSIDRREVKEAEGAVELIRVGKRGALRRDAPAHASWSTRVERQRIGVVQAACTT